MGARPPPEAGRSKGKGWLAGALATGAAPGFLEQPTIATMVAKAIPHATALHCLIVRSLAASAIQGYRNEAAIRRAIQIR